MEKRVLKFRAFCSLKKSMDYSRDPELDSFFDDNKNNPIMQFTGLYDSHGKEIYEGDVVNYSVKKRFCKSDGCDERIELGLSKFCPKCGKTVEDNDFITIAEVVHQKAAFGYQSYPGKDHYQHWPVYANEIYIAWVEVIGNIYENPELITPNP